MEKFRAGKPSRQLKAIVRSVFVCMPVYYEVKPDNLTVLDEILFFLFLDEISQQPLPYRHYINIQFVFDDVVLFVVFV